MLSNIMVRLDLTYGSFRLSFFPGKTSTLPTKKYLQKPYVLDPSPKHPPFLGFGFGAEGLVGLGRHPLGQRVHEKNSVRSPEAQSQRLQHTLLKEYLP